jgi:hypothetical protein
LPYRFSPFFFALFYSSIEEYHHPRDKSMKIKIEGSARHFILGAAYFLLVKHRKENFTFTFGKRVSIPCQSSIVYHKKIGLSNKNKKKGDGSFIPWYRKEICQSIQ